MRKVVIVILTLGTAVTLIVGVLGTIRQVDVTVPRRTLYHVGEWKLDAVSVRGKFHFWRVTVVEKPVPARTTYWSINPGWRYAAAWQDTSGITYPEDRPNAGVHVRLDRIGVGMVIPLLLFGAYPVLCFIRGPVRRWRRRRNGRCVHCGYDLTGNESGVCPECGRKVE